MVVGDKKNLPGGGISIYKVPEAGKKSLDLKNWKKVTMAGDLCTKRGEQEMR